MKAAAGRKWDWMAIGLLGVIVIVLFSGFIFTDKMFSGTDMMPMGYMMRKVVADYWKQHGTIPLWDPYILCGLPVVDAMHGDLFYPVSIFYVLMPLHKALGYKIVLHVWIAGVAMYFLLRTLGLRRRSSLIGAAGYMVAPYFLSLIYAGHDAKMFVTALFPLCMMLLERLLRDPKLLNSVLFGGSIGLLLLTSHPQMAYFASWGLGIYFILNIPRLMKNRVALKGISLLVLSVLLGIGIGCVQFLPTYYYTTNFSPRTGGVTLEFAASWSLHPEEIVSLLYPSFAGYLDDYWGRNYFKLNAESPGPLILLLAVAGFILLIRRRDILPWLVLFIFCPLYALGAHTPVFKAIFYALPGAKFLRAPSVIMFMFSCSSSVLAAFFIDSFLGKKVSESQRKLLMGMLVGILVLTIILSAGRGAFLDFWKGVFGWPDAQKLRTAETAAASWPSDVIGVAIFGWVVTGLLRTAYRKRWNGIIWLTILFVGLLVTGLRHSLRFIDYINVSDFVRRDPMIEFVSKDPGKFRTLPVTGWSFYNRNYLPIFGIETANGFYDNRSRYYDSLLGENYENLLDPNVMKITNIKYVLTTQEIPHSLLRLKQNFGRAFIYENREFMERAYIVHNAVVAESDSAGLEILKHTGFDPSTTIVLSAGQPMQGGPTLPEEHTTIESYDLNRIMLKASVTFDGYLVYSENYLPYWRAYVDGSEVPVERCNISMRAIRLPPGEHDIVMEYDSWWLRLGAYLCVGCCAFVGLSTAVCLKLRRKRVKDA
jgi:hypothetical protein